MYIYVNMMVLHVCWQAVTRHLEISNRIQQNKQCSTLEGTTCKPFQWVSTIAKKPCVPRELCYSSDKQGGVSVDP